MEILQELQKEKIEMKPQFAHINGIVVSSKFTNHTILQFNIYCTTTIKLSATNEKIIFALNILFDDYDMSIEITMCENYYILFRIYGFITNYCDTNSISRITTEYLSIDLCNKFTNFTIDDIYRLTNIVTILKSISPLKLIPSIFEYSINVLKYIGMFSTIDKDMICNTIVSTAKLLSAMKEENYIKLHNVDLYTAPVIFVDLPIETI